MDVTSVARLKPVAGIPPGKISINGVEIARPAIAEEMQHHPSRSPAEAWTAAARALAIRELLLQRARELGLAPQPQADADGRREMPEEALVRQVIEHDVVTPSPDAAACQRYYAQNAAKFSAPDLFEVDHILFAAPLGNDAERSAARAKADEVLRLLCANPERFGALAGAWSACPSRDVGGNLGQIGPGQTVPEFEAALRSMDVGADGARIVETRYGFHIVRVLRRQDGHVLPFELVSERIADFLRDTVRHTAIRQYISVLAGRAEVKGVDLAASSSPLVQ